MTLACEICTRRINAHHGICQVCRVAYCLAPANIVGMWCRADKGHGGEHYTVDDRDEITHRWGADGVAREVG